MIVDAHQHLGDCRVFDADIAEQTVLDCVAEHDLHRVLVMPFPGAEDPEGVHDRIAALGERSEGRVRGIVNLSPHRDRGAYAAEAERCVRELGFVALKLHTIGHAVEPDSRDGRTVFAEAERLGVPVMVHTGGVGEPFASPTHCLPLARAFPEVTIVLAHAGMGVATRQAGIVAIECPNVVLETSWCPVLDTGWLLSELGPERVMLGSDAVENLPVELAKFRALGLDDAALERCLSGTAIDVFGL
jgi:predicted TIM-barrel fold metal-dependent hydrolase